MNVKMLNWSLVLVLVLAMFLLPFAVAERSESSSVSNTWVELSDASTLNATSTALEYIIHFTATTALTGGADTVTITFPNGTTEMAGEEGSGYAFILPSSIDKDYVAVDPDSAATTTIGYTDCYTDPDVGAYRVRLKVPVDIAAGASPYIKFETSANIVSAAQGKTTAGARCHYRIKVETSKDTAAVYSEYFYLGGTAVSSVDNVAATGYAVTANTATNLPGYSQVVSPSMNSSSWTYSCGQTYTNQDMLVGEGYWIYMQNNCTLAGFTITPIQPLLE